jgi:chromate reductase
MNQNKNVAVFVGSLRKDSYNRKLAKALIALAPESLLLEIVEINNLPFYNQDFEENPSQEVLKFRQKVQAADAVLFVTPEYNRSVPAVLKNAIDIGSRPYGKNSWDNKPGAVISLSPGALGAFGANHHLRQSLVFVNVLTMAQPEAYIGNAANLFDDQGTLINDSTKEFLRKFLDAFAKWIDRSAVR